MGIALALRHFRVSLTVCRQLRCAFSAQLSLFRWRQAMYGRVSPCALRWRKGVPNMGRNMVCPLPSTTVVKGYGRVSVASELIKFFHSSFSFFTWWLFRYGGGKGLSERPFVQAHTAPTHSVSPARLDLAGAALRAFGFHCDIFGCFLAHKSA